MLPDKVVILLAVQDAEIACKKALRFLHGQGIEGHCGESDGTVTVEFDTPQHWSDSDVEPFRRRLMEYMKQDFQEGY